MRRRDFVRHGALWLPVARLLAQDDAVVTLVRRRAAAGGGSITRTLQNGTAGYGASVSVTLTGCTAGRLLVFGVVRMYVVTAPLLTEISGSNYESATLIVTSAERMGIGLFWALVTANGNVTMTWTPPTNDTLFAFLAEYTNANTSSPVGASAANNGYADAIATGDLAPSGNAAYVGWCSAQSAYTPAKHASYSEIYATAQGENAEACDLIGSGTKSIPWTLGEARGIECVGVAINEAT